MSHHEQPVGAGRRPNALADQTSPYLLQHACNPVDWHPWSPATLALARKLQRPIFLSIGYSTCYWCHVMERQCFENPDIAALMNDGFVNIKVDREERPDIDDLYMTAVQMITGSGGWPMSVFLTPPGAAGADDPGLEPFDAGTYFPPRDAYGRPGFPSVLRAISQAWRDRRGELLEQAGRVAQAMRSHLAPEPTPSPLSADQVSQAAGRLLRAYDSDDGGFGQAPKFPQPLNLRFLLHVHRNNQDADIAGALTHTLDRMARGGMYDQVGGGFHRYSTDERWLVPHFEKMLYDNGQLAELYALAHERLPRDGDPGLFARVAAETCDYILREMTDASGAFWSAQDAEVDSREGLNYLWNPREIRNVLDDPKLAELALAMYGLDEGPNFRDPHHRDEPARNVLYLPYPLAELARQRNMALDDLLAAR
ncbi:MAG: thioredoxin domain-containing protein, partial [Phycisphaeraceae bacterium]|nr:thioredoxin domain-containing protein [Phycisphaeraceae bacterium]